VKKRYFLISTRNTISKKCILEEVPETQMISFPRPADQGRLNATVFELLQMNFSGTVLVMGSWDASDTLDYLEDRLGIDVIPTLRPDGSLFSLRGKHILFISDGVIVTTFSADVSDLSWMSRSDA
jgi:hypothetical protein